MNSITIEDIGIKKEIELASHIVPKHFKRLTAVVWLDVNKIFYKVEHDGVVVSNHEKLEDALEDYNAIYILMDRKD